MDGELSGDGLRERLKQHGQKREGPGFYQLMTRLEDADLVEGATRPKKINEKTYQERFYKLTSQGELAIKAHLERLVQYSGRLRLI